MDLELVARTSAILLASSVIAALLRRAAPSTRHLVWHFAIVVVLLAPLSLRSRRQSRFQGFQKFQGFQRASF